MPASTRTSFTRVDHDRPGTSGGPPVVPPLPDLNLLDGRFDGHRRIFYDYLRDGARPVTAEGDAPPGEYRMRREVVDDYIVAGDADTEEGVEVHGGQERNWDHHSPVGTPQPGSRLAAEPTSPNRPSQDGASSQNSSQSGSSPELPSQISLTILLVNGKRKVMIFDSRTTVGRVKELVWNTWPNGKFYVFSVLVFLPALRSTSCLSGSSVSCALSFPFLIHAITLASWATRARYECDIGPKWSHNAAPLA